MTQESQEPPRNQWTRLEAGQINRALNEHRKLDLMLMGMQRHVEKIYERWWMQMIKLHKPLEWVGAQMAKDPDMIEVQRKISWAVNRKLYYQGRLKAYGIKNGNDLKLFKLTEEERVRDRR